MLKPPPNRLLQALRRLGRGAAGTEDGDASLLERFIGERDEGAFEALLRRHSELVWRVCRRHLSYADAEDSFQAVFLVLARDAARIGRRESLAGWLFRVAYFISRKTMGKTARRRALPIREDDRASELADDLAREETRAAVEAEVAALPDRLRAPVVLCYLEGRSNSEAAAILGCPKGTVDSRLAAARKRLHHRLLSRGITMSGLAALESLWQGEGNAGALPNLAERTLQAVSQFTRTGSAAGAVAHHVLSIVAGVANTMSTNRMTLLAAFAVLLTLGGGTGITVFNATADGQKTADDKPAAKPEEKTKPGDSLGARFEARPKAPKEPESADAVRDALRKPSGLTTPIENMTLKEFLQILSETFAVPIRLDLAAFSRMGYGGPVQMYDRPIHLPVVRGMTLADALSEALAQVNEGGGGDGAGQRTSITFRIRDRQIIIVPAYVPYMASVGGSAHAGQEEPLTSLPANLLLEQEEGEPVTLSVEEKSFTEVLQELRRTTGQNIVLDARQKDKAKLMVTATLHDVRLLAALRVLGDMCELQPVAMSNVYYVTSKENAAILQKEIDRRRYGDPSQFQGGFGLSGLGGGVAPTAPPTATKEEAKKDPAKK
jgi:RNA polymerase sigma factor (sigma-70 family)